MTEATGGAAGRDSVVTGGGSGIGRAICQRMAADGVVGVLDKNLAAARQTVQLIQAAGGNGWALEADVTESASLAAAFDELEQRGVEPDVVVACAGVDTTGTVIDQPEAEWDRVMAVNAKGVYLTARAAFPRFVERQHGSFVAIASDAGVLGARDFGIYCASKHAVVGFVRTLALDFGHLGIRSNVVCPGFVRTPMSEAHLAAAGSEVADYYTRVVPMGRFAEPGEVANAVAYLASPRASYTNGTIYLIDGGATAALHRGY